MTIPDESLIHEAQSGSLQSFNSLVERYQTQAYSLALRYVGDNYLAEDVTQEAFLSAWNSLGSFKGGSFRAWLFRIVLNECRDIHRKSARQPQMSLEKMLEEGSLLGIAEPSAGPDTVAMSGSTLRAIERCMQRLPDDQRVAVTLSDVQGFSYDEISVVLGVPVGTVKSRINRGRVQLRKLLLESGEL